MSNHMIYKLKIDGPYSPATIPMARLSEYMSDLAALLGETSSVHFSGLEEGSAILAASVEEAAIPKVSERLSHLRSGALGALRKSFDALDKRLAADSAVGSLTAYTGSNAGAVVLNFPGRERPRSVDYGLVRQDGSIDGVPVSVGGQDQTAHVILEGNKLTYAGINISRELAKNIAPFLYSAVIRLHGSGRWKRNQEGEWQLNNFNADRFEVLDDAPLREVLARLQSVPKSGWDEIEDPTSFLEDLRHAPDERHH